MKRLNINSCRRNFQIPLLSGFPMGFSSLHEERKSQGYYRHILSLTCD